MKTKAWTRLLHALVLASHQAGEEALERISTPVNLTVLPDGGNQSSPHLWGIMFEEMDHSGDGGIHGNLLQNNGFQGSDTGLTGYKTIGNTHISESDTPLSDAITSTLALSVRSDATGFVGFANTGYKGVPVLNATYSSTFWMKGEYSGPVMLRLVNSEDGTVYASHNVTVEKSRQKFEEYHATFEADASPVGDNEWQLLVDAEKAKGHILRFGLVQLFPPTWNDRANGLRADLIQPIYDLQPKFLRFPGGNNIEGIDVDSRWKWNETIGPVVNRPGRDTPWHYPNTDALGLDEYLWWCEDMGMTPVLTVWDGKSYDQILSGDDLHPFLDDILDELEYLLGPSNSTYGSQRAKNGREQPWPVQYIEIGNEDDYTGGCDTYPDRLTQIYNTIHDAYPNLTLIADNMDPNCLPADPIPDIMYDYHYYRKPDALVDMFNYWDNQPRDQPVIVGEFGCRNHSDPGGLFWAFVKGSCSEAVHMIGMERNSDVVLMAAYAPLLQHFGYMQWSPTLFGFDSSPDSLTLSTSYYVQKMFATNHGTKTHPIESDSDFGPVYWVASSNDTHYQIKLANYNRENHTVNVQVPGAKNETGSLEMLAGEENASNQPHDIVVTPTVNEIKNGSDGFTVHMPPYGVAVLVVS